MWAPVSSRGHICHIRSVLMFPLLNYHSWMSLWQLVLLLQSHSRLIFSPLRKQLRFKMQFFIMTNFWMGRDARSCSINKALLKADLALTLICKINKNTWSYIEKLTASWLKSKQDLVEIHGSLILMKRTILFWLLFVIAREQQEYLVVVQRHLVSHWEIQKAK